MTIILCAYCPWQGPHLRALWEHLAEKHGYTPHLSGAVSIGKSKGPI